MLRFILTISLATPLLQGYSFRRTLSVLWRRLRRGKLRSLLDCSQTLEGNTTSDPKRRDAKSSHHSSTLIVYAGELSNTRLVCKGGWDSAENNSRRKSFPAYFCLLTWTLAGFVCNENTKFIRYTFVDVNIIYYIYTYRKRKVYCGRHMRQRS